MQEIGDYKLPAAEDGDDADMPQYSGLMALRVSDALAGKLSFAKGQSNNPVTVWATPQNVDNTHTGGQNIQFQWDDSSVPDKPTLRCHVDARAGEPGMLGAIGAGKAFFDLAWLPGDQVSIGLFGGYKDTRYAVASGSLNGQTHDLLMAYNWTDGSRFLIAENGRHVGQLRVEQPSTAAAKTNLREAKVGKRNADEPDFVGMLDATRVYDYEFLSAEEYPANGAFAGTSHVGWLASEVAENAAAAGLPDGLVTRDEAGEPDGISDRDMLAVLWQVVKEQRAQIVELSARVDALETP